jgi:hypothetical protein
VENAIGTTLVLIVAVILVLKDYEDGNVIDGQGAFIKAVIEFFKPYGQYIMYWLFAIWGGTSSYLMELHASGGRVSFKMWAGRMVVSGFAGFLMVLMCVSLGLPIGVVGISAGIGGYMGGSAILMIQKMIVKRVQS